jgi:hypothetical protein
LYDSLEGTCKGSGLGLEAQQQFVKDWPPNVNRLTIGILALVAEAERRATYISTRDVLVFLNVGGTDFRVTTDVIAPPLGAPIVDHRLDAE